MLYKTMKRILILMAKQPMPNQVKTRLLSTLTPFQAAELYECFLRDKCEAMRQLSDSDCAIAFTPSDAYPYFRALAPDFALYLQEGTTLSERLKYVVSQAFQDGYEYVMPIDGDSVTLPIQYLQMGFERLSAPKIDIVVGPSDDGGYYAIGLKAPHPYVFDVEMSTPHVCHDTLLMAQQHGLKAFLLPEWYDVDTPDDLERLLLELKANPALAPYTSAYLKEIF